MPRYAYKVVPAPAKGLKGKGVKGPEARFSNALQELMNGLAAEGWEYQRAETLPSVERSGLTGSTTEWRNVLVFRRPREGLGIVFAPELLPPPVVPVSADAAPEEPTETPQEEEAVEPLEEAVETIEAVEETTEEVQAETEGTADNHEDKDEESTTKPES